MDVLAKIAKESVGVDFLVSWGSLVKVPGTAVFECLLSAILIPYVKIDPCRARCEKQ